MAADRRGETGRYSPAFDHQQNISSARRIFRELPAPVYAPEEETFLFSSYAGRVEILVEVRFSVVVSRHFVTFAAFLMQPYPKAFAVLGKVVLNFHVYDRTDTGKGVAHESNQSPIAQAYDRVCFDRV